MLLIFSMMNHQPKKTTQQQQHDDNSYDDNCDSSDNNNNNNKRGKSGSYSNDNDNDNDNNNNDNHLHLLQISNSSFESLLLPRNGMSASSLSSITTTRGGGGGGRRRSSSHSTTRGSSNNNSHQVHHDVTQTKNEHSDEKKEIRIIHQYTDDDYDDDDQNNNNNNNDDEWTPLVKFHHHRHNHHHTDNPRHTDHTNGKGRCCKSNNDIFMDHHHHHNDDGTDDTDDTDDNNSINIENKTILMLRLCLLGVLAISTGMVAYMSYYLIKHSENEKFILSFQHSSETIFDTIGRTLKVTLGSIDTFVVNVVDFARYTDQSWPFVTYPNYAISVAKIRARANLACVNQFMVVPANQRQQWELYASKHDTWVEDGLNVQKHDINYHGTTKQVLPINELKSNCILGSDGNCFPYNNNYYVDDDEQKQQQEEEADNHRNINQTTTVHNINSNTTTTTKQQQQQISQPSFYLPNWQSSPVMPTGSAYNWDFSTVYNNPEYQIEVFKRKVIMAEVYNVPIMITPAEDDDNVKTTTTTTEDSSDDDVDTDPSINEASKTIIDFIKYLDPKRDPSEPMSDIIYPITRNAPDYVMASSSSATPSATPSHDNKNKNSNNNSNTNTTTSRPPDNDDDDDDDDDVVGFIITTLFWSDLIEHILPEGLDGMIFVMENNCQQVFSYLIEGPTVTYLGPGDYHDTQYDSLIQQTSFLELLSSSSSTSSSSHNSNNNNMMNQVVYTGLPLSNKGCPFHLRVYPSKQYEQMFISNDPFIYTINVLLIFGFVSCLFCAWDTCVERRHKSQLQGLLESSAIATQLETKIQERTQQIQETNTQLEEANRRLAASSKAQLQTFASMSHEIRTPLNCIIGLSSLLLETELNPNQAESMQMVASSSDLLLAVVNDVLDYSKLESGNVEVDKRRSNLQEILNSVVFAIETKAYDKDVQLKTMFDPNVGPFMNTDSRRLQQILYNLLGNAIKFSNPGSDVELMITFSNYYYYDDNYSKGSVGTTIAGTHYYSPTPDDKQQQDKQLANATTKTTNKNGPVIRFTIKNSGIGIKKKNLRTIFEPFRCDSGVNGGTGLGLAITTRLVHALHGRISVESMDGQWVMFTVEFPSSYKESADIQALSQAVKNTTIVLISCEPDVVEQLKDVLEIFSLNLHTFETLVNLKQSLVASKQNNIDDDFGSHLICLVDEVLYDNTIFKELKSTANAELSLITFGPKHMITSARDHFRSLLRLLPSILMEHLGSCIEPSQSSETVLVRDSSSRRISAGDADRISYQDYRVLVAEDNVINQKVLVRMLKRLGIHSISVVDNGKKAVEMEELKPFDIVLMDMQMPVMNGVEACKLIIGRKSCNHPKAKVFFVTAHAAAEFENICQKAGGAGFLPKPFNIGEIEKCFQKLHTLLEEEEEKKTKAPSL